MLALNSVNCTLQTNLFKQAYTHKHPHRQRETERERLHIQYQISFYVYDAIKDFQYMFYGYMTVYR